MSDRVSNDKVEEAIKVIEKFIGDCTLTNSTNLYRNEEMPNPLIRASTEVVPWLNRLLTWRKEQ